jgi:hypothetical protein
MTLIRRINFAPVVQQMIPHPAEEKKVPAKEKPKKVEKTHHTVDKKC